MLTTGSSVEGIRWDAHTGPDGSVLREDMESLGLSQEDEQFRNNWRSRI